MIFVHYTKLLAFVLALPNPFFLFVQTVSFYLQCLFEKDSGNLLFSKCQYSPGFGLKLAMPVEETKDPRLCLGILVHAVDSLLVLLPTVNIGVNQNHEAFEPSLLCAPSSHQMDSLVITASLETLWLVLLRLRDHRFMASL